VDEMVAVELMAAVVELVVEESTAVEKPWSPMPDLTENSSASSTSLPATEKLAATIR